METSPKDKSGSRATLTPSDRSTTLRTAVAFWILGLCNNYGYVVMLSAAHDILSDRFHDGDAPEPTHAPNSTVRDCNQLSTGAILLADILPSLFIKTTAPFFPLLIHLRIGLVVVMSVAGYILVAEAPAIWVAILGVVCTAIASGLGEVSLLAYMSKYKGKTAVSNWSSGTGGAGFFGSFTYAGLTMVLGSPKATLYTLNVIPLLMAVTFWFLLPKPPAQDTPLPTQDTQPDFPLRDKLRYIPHLLRYMVPLMLVYFFEYFINQGLFELIQYDLSWLSHGDQYKWYQVLYQIGVFISRSSLLLFEINQLWLLALLQGLNVILFTTEAIYSYFPHIAISFVVILIEGFFGGAAYVNTYNRISKEVPEDKRLFSMSIVSLSDALGISTAGFLAMPVHNYICGLPIYNHN